VYVKKATYDLAGAFDERFVGYGFEDNDYCARLTRKGFRLGIWDGCVVDHSASIHFSHFVPSLK
jgi:GT2 family glycosyltransferase